MDSRENHRPQRTLAAMRSLFAYMTLSFFSFIPFFSQSAASAPLIHSFLGYEARFEDSANGSQKEVRSQFRLGGGLDWTQWRWMSELGYMKETTGEGFISIESQSYDWFNWAQYILNPDKEYRFYVGGGLGLALYKVKTTVNQSSTTKWSDLHFDLGALGGIEKNFNQRVGGGAELRVYKTEQKKDPIISGLLKITLNF